jgi:hypothetical protein
MHICVIYTAEGRAMAAIFDCRRRLVRLVIDSGIPKMEGEAEDENARKKT